MPSNNAGTKIGEIKMGNALGGIGLISWLVLSWITHLVICFKSASWGFLIAGAIFFPVAVVHGTGCWFGAW